MKMIKTTASITLLASVIATGSTLTASPAVADGLVDMNIQEVNGKIHLVVKRQLPDGTAKYEHVPVPSEEADEREAELLQAPDVLYVERSTIAYNPIPLTESPMVRSQSANTGEAKPDGVTYDDPLFHKQEWFTPGHEHNSRLSEAHARLAFNNTIRVGIVDGGFVRSPDVTYAEGVSLYFGRGPDFYNSDPGIECELLQPGEEMSEHGHHVAQVLGATPNNGTGIAGASPNVELVAARSLGCAGLGFSLYSAEAVRWLAQDPDITDLPSISEPVDIINMSISSETECPSYTQEAINYARSKGITVVVAAGNDYGDSMDYSPANCQGVVTVGATTHNGYPSDFTNAGVNITVAAQGAAMAVLDANGEEISIYGTSFASPLVAGIIASAMSDRPGMPPAYIDSILETSGKPMRLYSTSNREWDMGAGILDAMLFLDGAGVARETVTVQPALSGSREQFTEALTHPAAEHYLQDRTGAAGVCDIVEVNGQSLSNPTDQDSIAVFSMTEGGPLNPTNHLADIIAQTDVAEAMAFTISELSAEAGSNRQLGVAHCNLTTGSNCSVKDTVKALDITNLPTPTACI